MVKRIYLTEEATKTETDLIEYDPDDGTIIEWLHPDHTDGIWTNVSVDLVKTVNPLKYLKVQLMIDQAMGRY